MDSQEESLVTPEKTFEKKSTYLLYWFAGGLLEDPKKGHMFREQLGSMLD